MKKYILFLLILPVIAFAKYDEFGDSVRTCHTADSLVGFDRDSTFSVITVDTIRATDTLYLKANVRITKNVWVDSSTIIKNQSLKADTLDDYNDGKITTKANLFINDTLNVGVAVIDSLDSLGMIRAKGDTLRLDQSMRVGDYLRVGQSAYIGADLTLLGDIDSADNINTKYLNADSANIDTVGNNLVVRDTVKADVFAAPSGNTAIGTGAITDISGKLLADTADADVGIIDNLTVTDSAKGIDEIIVSIPAGSWDYPPTNFAPLDKWTEPNRWILVQAFDSTAVCSLYGDLFTPTTLSNIDSIGFVFIGRPGVAGASGSDTVVFAFWHDVITDGDSTGGAYTVDSTFKFTCNTTLGRANITTFKRAVTDLGWTGGDEVRFILGRLPANVADVLNSRYGLKRFIIYKD